MVILDVAAFAAHRTETEHAGIELPESLRDQELSGDTTPPVTHDRRVTKILIGG